MKKAKTVAIVFTASFIFIAVGVMTASAVPKIPHRVYGDVTYEDGNPAADVNIYFKNDVGNVVASDVTDSNGFYDTDEAPGLENNIPEPEDKTLDIYVGDWDSGKNLQWKSGESERINITVPNQPPTASFSYSPSSPTDADTIQFNDDSSDSDGHIDSWSWNFGDGDTSTAQNPTHQYSDDGTYTVTLQVTDNGSPAMSDSVSQDISVSNEPPTADFSYSPSSPENGETVNFDAGASSDLGTIENYEWDWGADGTIDATGVTASHSFSTTGDHPVWLRVTDDDGAENSITKTVTVSAPAPMNEPPTARFSYSPTEPIVDETVSFDATGSFDPDGHIVSYDWDLDGDGQYDDATGSTTSKSFPSASDYEVGVKVTDNGGAVDHTRKTITVSTAPPPAEFEVSDLSISPEKANPGETVKVAVGVTNVGGQSGSYDVEFYVEGTLEDTETVSLSPDESTTVQFTTSRGEEGTYDVEVDGLTGSFTVQKPSAFPTGTAIIITVVVIIVVLLGLLWWY